MVVKLANQAAAAACSRTRSMRTSVSRIIRVTGVPLNQSSTRFSLPPQFPGELRSVGSIAKEAKDALSLPVGESLSPRPRQSDLLTGVRCVRPYPQAQGFQRVLLHRHAPASGFGLEESLHVRW